MLNSTSKMTNIEIEMVRQRPLSKYPNVVVHPCGKNTYREAIQTCQKQVKHQQTAQICQAFASFACLFKTVFSPGRVYCVRIFTWWMVFGCVRAGSDARVCVPPVSLSSITTSRCLSVCRWFCFSHYLMLITCLLQHRLWY